jgi:hypothetical protein
MPRCPAFSVKIVCASKEQALRCRRDLEHRRGEFLLSNPEDLPLFGIDSQQLFSVRCIDPASAANKAAKSSSPSSSVFAILHSNCPERRSSRVSPSSVGSRTTVFSVSESQRRYLILWALEARAGSEYKPCCFHTASRFVSGGNHHVSTLGRLAENEHQVARRQLS